MPLCRLAVPARSPSSSARASSWRGRGRNRAPRFKSRVLTLYFSLLQTRFLARCGCARALLTHLTPYLTLTTVSTHMPHYVYILCTILSCLIFMGVFQNQSSSSTTPYFIHLSSHLTQHVQTKQRHSSLSRPDSTLLLPRLTALRFTLAPYATPVRSAREVAN